MKQKQRFALLLTAVLLLGVFRVPGGAEAAPENADDPYRLVELYCS